MLDQHYHQDGPHIEIQIVLIFLYSIIQKINPTLTIYTKNYIFYRREYDGAEWFEYVPAKQYILDNADAFNDKNIIHADTYYGRNNYCWNEGYE